MIENIEQKLSHSLNVDLIMSLAETSIGNSTHNFYGRIKLIEPGWLTITKLSGKKFPVDENTYSMRLENIESLDIYKGK